MFIMSHTVIPWWCPDSTDIRRKYE